MGLDGDDRGRQPVQLRLKGEREREREAGEGERDRREEVRSDNRKKEKKTF